ADTAWSFILAAAAAAVLALVVLVLRRTRSRADAREIALLAVLGAGRSGAKRVRVSEDLFALSMGVLGGLAAGAVTAWLVVPPLVRAAYVSVPDGFPIAVQADVLTFAGAVAATVAVFALVVGSVRAPSALSPLVREDE
ncbi:FtsX-like permease family protein, partial [Microbacterium thalassium]